MSFAYLINHTEASTVARKEQQTRIGRKADCCIKMEPGAYARSARKFRARAHIAHSTALRDVCPAAQGTQNKSSASMVRSAV